MLTPIRAYRLAKGWTCKELSKRSGVTLGSLYRYDRGAADPPLRILRRLAEVLEVGVEHLIDSKITLDRE